MKPKKSSIRTWIESTKRSLTLVRINSETPFKEAKKKINTYFKNKKTVKIKDNYLFFSKTESTQNLQQKFMS